MVLGRDAWKSFSKPVRLLLPSVCLDVEKKTYFLLIVFHLSILWILLMSYSSIDSILLLLFYSWGFHGGASLQHHRQATQLGHGILGSWGNNGHHNHRVLPNPQHAHQNGPHHRENGLILETTVSGYKAQTLFVTNCTWTRFDQTIVKQSVT